MCGGGYNSSPYILRRRRYSRPYDINYCYLYQPNSTFARLEYKANGEFLIDINDPLALKPVRLTKPAPRDLSVKVGIDPSLVDEYNQANNTEYTFLEGASIVNPVLTIPAGQYVSPEVITVTFGDKRDSRPRPPTSCSRLS